VGANRALILLVSVILLTYVLFVITVIGPSDNPFTAGGRNQTNIVIFGLSALGFAYTVRQFARSLRTNDIVNRPQNNTQAGDDHGNSVDDIASDDDTLASGIRTSVRTSDERTYTDESDSHFEIVNATLIETIQGLQYERTKSISSANANLVTGFIWAIVGAGSLLYTITVGPFDNLGTSVLRGLFTLTCTTLAFFFFQIYKAGMQDRKHFQNEITNVVFKRQAKELAMREEFTPKERVELLKPVIASYLATERNHVLKKGESTVAHQTNAVDNELLLKLFDKIPNKSNP
jgi:positive regulator of sigma E activity